MSSTELRILTDLDAELEKKQSLEQMRELIVELVETSENGEGIIYILENAKILERKDVADLVAEKCIKRGLYYQALKAALYSKNKDVLKIIGDQCSNNGRFQDATIAFSTLKDKEGLLKVIQTTDRQILNSGVNVELFEEYIGKDIINIVNQSLQDFYKNKVFKKTYSMLLGPTINMAYNLSQEHDLGVGIARGGLTSAFLASAFGLETRVVDSHKTGQGATYKAVDEITQEDVRNKRIVVFDKDIVTGRTANRISKELSKFEPLSINLALNYDLRLSRDQNLPVHDYEKVFFSKDFDYGRFEEAADALKKALSKK